MNKLPRTFCVTLKETPLRKKAFQESAKKAGIEATMFDGILGTRMGLIAKFPNTIECPGGNVMLNEGALGCNMSHFILWHVLKYLPDEEFLIFEDDALIEPDFKEKFFPIYEKLPIDWQMAYVGWIPYGKDIPPLAIEDGISIRIPSATHAYLVKKSILNELCDALLPIQSPLDLTLIRRVLPRIKYYVFDPSIVEQRSFLNVNDPVWLSLTYDWKNDHYGAKSTMLKDLALKSGWHPLENNDKEKWIWSQNEFSITLPKNIDAVTLDCSTPIPNAVFMDRGTEKRKLPLVVGNNLITVATSGVEELRASMDERFIPSQRDTQSKDSRTLGICLKNITLHVGAQTIAVDIADLAQKIEPPMSFKL